MTTIAYRDGVMASDSLAVMAGYVKIGGTPKVFRIKGCLVGLTGTARLIRMFTDWFEANYMENNLPPIAPDLTKDSPGQDDSINAYVVLPNGKIWRYESGAAPYPVVAAFVAGGSGSDFAIGAMDRGATAAQAVAVAAKYDVNTAGTIQTMKLAVKSKKKPTPVPRKKLKQFRVEPNPDIDFNELTLPSYICE